MPSVPGVGSLNLTNSNENPQWTNQDSFGRVWRFVDLLPDQVAKLGYLEPKPGMSIEGYIHTGNRTVAVYLTRPIIDNLGKAVCAEKTLPGNLFKKTLKRLRPASKLWSGRTTALCGPVFAKNAAWMRLASRPTLQAERARHLFKIVIYVCCGYNVGPRRMNHVVRGKAPTNWHWEFPEDCLTDVIVRFHVQRETMLAA